MADKPDDTSGRSFWSSLRRGLGGGEAEPESTQVPQPPAFVFDAVVFCDADTTIRAVNAASESLLGRGAAELLGRLLVDWVPSIDTLEGRRPTRKRPAGASTAPAWELELQLADETFVTVEVTKAPVPESELVAFVLRDLSDRKKQTRRLTRANERLAAARDDSIELSKAKTITMARVAEVLRTPLSAIIGYAEMLVEEAQERGEDEMLSDVQRILESSGALLAILKNVLDLAEIEAGRMSVLQSNFDVVGEVRKVLESHRAMARQRDNTLNLMMLASVGEAYADRERTIQVLDNVLDNAIRYTEGGDISVQVMREPVGDSEQIAIQITDTGRGIPQADLGKLFTQYGRGGSRDATGAGISLVVSSSLAKLMGGSLSATSREGRGSSFTLTLPAFTVQHEIHPPMLTATGLPAPRRVSQPAVRLAIHDADLRARLVASLARGGWPSDVVPHDREHAAELSADTLVVVDKGGDFALLEALRGHRGARPPVLLVLHTPVSAGPRKALDKLATTVCELDLSGGDHALDRVLHGALTRSIMMGAMNVRLGPPRPSMVPPSDQT